MAKLPLKETHVYAMTNTPLGDMAIDLGVADIRDVVLRIKKFEKVFDPYDFNQLEYIWLSVDSYTYLAHNNEGRWRVALHEGSYPTEVDLIAQVDLK